MAVEASARVSPAAGAWFEGGRWIDIIASDRPSIQGQQATIFPQGYAGRRSMNQQPPVVGRKWSEGDVSFQIVEDILPLLLYGVMGGLSSNSVPSTDASLVENFALSGDLAVDLTSQPSDGGAILLFNITSTSTGGDITIQGIDAAGNGASETITYASAGQYWSRKSWSAIGPSSINITNSNASQAGSLTILGFKYFEHTISASETNPTISMERVGTPSTGAASKSFFHPGMVVMSVGFNVPADSRDGVMSMDASFEGDFPTACTATDLNHASPMAIWPAWGASITRDGSTYQRIMNFSLDIQGGNRNYRTAAGTQNPQGAFFGPREVTGDFQMLIQDESEYERWAGASKSQYVIWMNSPWVLQGNTYRAFTASLTDAYTESSTEGDTDDMQVLDQSFRMIDNAADDVLKVYVRNGVPPTAYGSPLNGYTLDAD